MQAVWLKSGLLGAVISLLSLGSLFGQNSATFNVHDRVGDVFGSITSSSLTSSHTTMTSDY